MAKPGRNEPCPCGSGKKFKQCCGVTSRPAGTFTDADRSDAIDALMRFAERPEFDEIAAIAAHLWTPDDIDDDAEAAFESFASDELSVAAYFEWLLFDAALTNRTTLADLFLARPAARRLSPRTLDWIRAMSRSHLQPYLVKDVADAHLTARDLWTGRELTIRMAPPMPPFVAWDLLVMRLRDDPSGAPEIRVADAAASAVGHAGVPVADGVVLILPCDARRPLQRDLKRLYRAFRRRRPEGSASLFFKQHAPLFNRYWFDYVVDADGEIETIEGEPVTLNRLVLDVPAAASALVTLLAQPDFEPAGPAALWTPPIDGEPIVLATVGTEAGRLTVEAWTPDRLDRAYTRLQDVLGALPILSREHQEPTPADDIDAPPDPIDRDWLERPEPTLNGKTPREAVRIPRLRPLLTDLLISVENEQARVALGGERVDTSWLWTELALPRP